MKSFIFVLITLFSLTACSLSSDEKTEFTLKLNKSNFVASDTIVVSFTIKNKSDESKLFNFPSSGQLGIMVSQNNKNLYGHNLMYLQILTSLEVPANNSIFLERKIAINQFKHLLELNKKVEVDVFLMGDNSPKYSREIIIQ